MWTINNNTPFATERCWVRDRIGAEVWLVAIKATFDIRPDGQLCLAEEQEVVNLAPKSREDGENPSLLYDTDMPHLKNNTDVLVEGHAYTPRGEPASDVHVRLQVANINKTLRVFGDRVWQQTLGKASLTRPRPFTKMPLVWERAFGGSDLSAENSKHHGWEARNPAGCGFATHQEHLDEQAAPNIEDPQALIGHWNDRPNPLCFAPIAGHWSPRVELAGTYDENWEQTKQPLLPDDFDDAILFTSPVIFYYN